MYNGLIFLLAIALAAMTASGNLSAQIYKVVDENGNITYTDEPPRDGSEPMLLPDISVVETQNQPEVAAVPGDEMGVDGGADADAEVAKTPRQLRQMFKDFRILSPQADETYWGTANTVVVSWGASAPYEEGMSVSILVNGQSQDAEPNANLAFTLDRGTHQVQAVLQDQRGRRIATSEAVTFYIKQASRRN